jgi:hypothetical protein
MGDARDGWGVNWSWPSKLIIPGDHLFLQGFLFRESWYDKLIEKMGKITPEQVKSLSDEL